MINPVSRVAWAPAKVEDFVTTPSLLDTKLLRNFTRSERATTYGLPCWNAFALLRWLRQA